MVVKLLEEANSKLDETLTSQREEIESLHEDHAKLTKDLGEVRKENITINTDIQVERV